ncbi:ThuA domain-containing protein [Microbacterium jejuense]|uniref:ThuA domain-containing protein n=1 Tax=Microbacterium jejuense TaxID=1263637 RepID=A0ABS7HRI7_9MICO|nr:ThuA domain-containing protein [Microbacterium jejuense]MBW9094827.1 ThuA domain-containing protein [Microbacterium jejuense]
MTTTSQRGPRRSAPRALVVRDGHARPGPAQATEMFLPFLLHEGYEVRVEESSEIYADREVMDRTDLIVQCVATSAISDAALRGLLRAVERGTGLAGWHRGIADSYGSNADYLQLIGGQFVPRPWPQDGDRPADDAGRSCCYTVDLTDQGRTHEIMAGIEDFTLRSEPYWVLTDDLNDVLATTTYGARPDDPWRRPLTSPAVWTRQWGDGRVFVATPGHSLVVLRDAHVRAIIQRGMLWASRTAMAA